MIYQTLTGEIRVDPASCMECSSKPCASACPEGILALVDGIPNLAKPADSVRRGLCRECLACEIVCAMDGAGGLALFLPIEGMDS